MNQGTRDLIANDYGRMRQADISSWAKKAHFFKRPDCGFPVDRHVERITSLKKLTERPNVAEPPRGVVCMIGTETEPTTQEVMKKLEKRSNAIFDAIDISTRMAALYAGLPQPLPGPGNFQVE